MANRNLKGDVNVEFTEASSRQGLDSGESVKTLFGKIRKWLSDLKAVAFSGSYTDLINKPTLGSAASKNVPSSGNASTSEVVMGNDSRLTNSRPASDVYSWAKAASKPTYTASEVGLGNVGNFKAVSTVASQGLSDTEKANARANISAATSAQGTKADSAVQTIQINGTTQTKTNGTVNLPAYPTKSSLGLGNVNNTSDLNKPISTATQAALDAQQAQIDDNSEISETSDTTPYIYKSSEHDAVYDELVGGSVAWNQLVANSGSSLSVTITSGHKYVMKKSGTLSVGASSGSAITGLTGGTDWITDLTLMFGTTIADYVYSLEQSTAGSGIAWLKSYGFFAKDYYEYNAGTLTSANVSGKKVVSETAEITYPIQSTDLRGLYKLNGNKLYTDGDIYSADGIVTRKYGIVDLGTLDWGFNNASGHQYFWTAGIVSTIKKVASVYDKSNSVCGNYIIKSYANVYANSLDKIIGVSDSGRIAIYDSSKIAMSVEQFKTAMSGVYLIYELATPTTAPAPPFTSPQMVYRNGTEEYLDTRDVPLPVGGNRKYVDIPEWMVNEYFDDVRAETSTLLVKIENINNDINEIKSDMQGVTQDLDDISEELDCLIIRAALVNDEVRIQNTSDFTDELYRKYASRTKPKFAILELHITSSTHYYKALINTSSVSQATVMEASFITVNGTYMSIYKFNWSLSGTVGTPTVSHTSLNLGS